MDSPGAVVGHSSAVCPGALQVLLFGGRGPSVLNSDLWSFDTRQGWIKVPPASTGAEGPAARAHAALACHKGWLYLVGGLGTSEAPLRDAW
eukprot:gene103-10990_t